MFTRSTPSLWAVAGAPLALALLAGCGGNDDGGSTVVTPKSCDTAALASLKLGKASVKAAAAVPAGSYTRPGTNTALTDLPAFCRIDAAATPTGDSLINFQVWVPMGSAWKLVTTGNGGYSPALSYRDIGAFAARRRTARCADGTRPLGRAGHCAGFDSRVACREWKHGAYAAVMRLSEESRLQGHGQYRRRGQLQLSVNAAMNQ